MKKSHNQPEESANRGQQSSKPVSPLQQTAPQGHPWRPSRAVTTPVGLPSFLPVNHPFANLGKPDGRPDNTKRCSCKRELKAFLECLSQHPMYKSYGCDFTCRKPKQSPEQRLGRLCKNMAAPNTLAPALLHAFKRYDAGQSAANDLERGLFTRFGSMTDAQKEAFRKTISYLNAVPDHLKKCIFNPRYTDLNINSHITLEGLIDDLSKEILAHGIGIEYPRAVLIGLNTAPGIPRPQTMGGPGDEFYPEPIEILMPTVCAINGLRRTGFTPTPDRWREEELIRECTFVDVDSPRFVCGDYRTSAEGCPDGSTPGGVCLRVPSVRVGGTVDLTGYNFISAEARIRLRRRDEPRDEFVLNAHVIGDMVTPLEEMVGSQARVIANCRVEDHIIFQIPERRLDGVNEFLTGDYELRVEIPNPDRRYHNFLREAPDYLISFPHLIHVAPSPNIPYRISLDRVICDEETDGAGSDEVFIRFLVNGMQGMNLTPLSTPDPWEYDDVDSGEIFAGNRTLFEGSFPDILTIAVMGFEVDDEELLRQGIRDFDEAFLYALGWLWDQISPHLGEIGSGIAAIANEVGYGWTAIIIGIAIVLTLAFDALWALWAPPDPIIFDLIVLPAELIHFLTHPLNPLPDPSEARQISGIWGAVSPEEKLLNDYLEFRTYWAEDEGSTYRLRIRYTQL